MSVTERTYQALLAELQRQSKHGAATWSKLDVMALAEAVVHASEREGRNLHSSSELGLG